MRTSSVNTGTVQTRPLDQPLASSDQAPDDHRDHAPAAARDVLTPKEIADRSSFSYQAILRAIRRGDLRAYEPVPGRYRVALAEYERWLKTPRRHEAAISPTPDPQPRRRGRGNDKDPGSFARLTAIEGGS